MSMMLPELGALAPDFTAESTQGTIRFHEWIGDEWAIFFTHPKDYAAVCMTEVAEVARLKPEWDRRRAKALGLSVNPLADHTGWEKEVQELEGCAVNFPIIADTDKKVAALYGMIHPAHDPVATARILFIIDPAKKVRLFLVYPRLTGRNFKEVLRVLDSLQMTDKHRLATPANWEPGEDLVIPPFVTDDAARQKFPGGWKTPKPHLRFIADPEKKRGLP